jgi:hypothetical protein
LGTIYIGSPVSQKAKVVLDTGSDWLAIKSCLSDAHCHTPKSYHLNETSTGEAVNNIGFPLAYGSANLEGFKF